MGVQTTTATPHGSLDTTLRHDLFGLFDESDYSPRGSSRSHLHSYDASVKHDDIIHRDDVDDSSRSHRSRSNPSK